MDGLAFGIGQQLGAWGSLAGAVFGLVFFLYHDAYKAELSRANIIRHLRYDTLGAFYRAVLVGRLRWLDQRLSPREVALPDGTPGKAVAVAWSHGLLNLAIILALAYPILSLLLRWFFTGQGGIDELLIFPIEVPLLRRGVAVIGFTLFAVLVSYLTLSRNLYKKTKIRSTKVFIILLISIVVVGIVPFSYEEIGITTRVIASVSAVTFSSFLAFSTTTAPVAALIQISCVIFLFGVAAFSYEIYANFGLSVSISLVVFMFFVLVLCSQAVRWFSIRTNRPTLVLGIWASLGFLVVCVMTIRGSGLPADGAGVVLFLGLLPLLNAAADFASVGLTRYFLAQGIEAKRPVWAAVKDLVCGVMIFALLGCAIIATLHVVRPADGTALLDLPALFADLHANPGAYWWLGFMLFSTLLPTLAHATLGLFTLFTLTPPGLRTWIADRFEKGGADDLVAWRTGVFALCALATAAIVLPLYLFWQAVRHAPWAVDAVITGFEGFARLIGAV